MERSLLEKIIIFYRAKVSMVVGDGEEQARPSGRALLWVVYAADGVHDPP